MYTRWLENAFETVDLPRDEKLEIIRSIGALEDCLKNYLRGHGSIAGEKDIKRAFANCLKPGGPIGIIPGKGGECPRILYVVSGSSNFEKRLNDVLRATEKCRRLICAIIFCPYCWNGRMDSRLKDFLPRLKLNGAQRVFLRIPFDSEPRILG